MVLPCPDAYSVFWGFSLCVLTHILPKAAARIALLLSRVQKKCEADDDTCVASSPVDAADTCEPEEETAPAPLVEEHAIVSRPRFLLPYFGVVVAFLVCLVVACCFFRDIEDENADEIESSNSSVCNDILPRFETGQLQTVNLTRQVIPVQRFGGKLKYKSAYWGTLNIGTPRASFKIVFDTGSGHLILPSSYCSSETCKQHKRYRRSQSITSKDIDHDGSEVDGKDGRDQLKVNFGKGIVDGVFISDIVCLGLADARDDKLERAGDPVALDDGCVNLRFIAATDMSEEPFAAFEFDGILGLGLSALSQTPEFNFVSELRGRGIFSIHLADEGTDETSEITFGGWKSNRYKGRDIFWNRLLMPEQGHWMLRIKSIYVDDVNLNLCNDDCHAIADSGSSLLTVPSSSFKAIFTSLRHEPTDQNCRGPGPTLRIMLENFEIRLEPQSYARLDPAANETDTAMCKAMMMVMNMPAPLGPKLFILGEPVLRRYYSVFDSINFRIGFAPSSQR